MEEEKKEAEEGFKIKFEIKGEPVSKERPRMGRYGTYTPKKTKDYEKLIAKSFYEAYPKFEPMIENVEIYAKVNIYFEVPKSYSKKKREMLLPNEKNGFKYGAGYKGKKDIDNICKSVLDGLNGIAYVDDSQITGLLATKEYGNEAKVKVELIPTGKFI